MIVNEQPLNVERSGKFKERSFTIKASRKAFDILSSQIYTDVIQAIIRELSTNAFDSHKQAGTTSIPFKIHLPNSFEPHFSIRDFGTGLSQDDLENMYTTYFDSNKTNSNEFTGCLGIGSKSPFAYTDNFTVCSYFKGKKYTYTAFRGEDGFPSIALMNEVDTDQHDGLEIIIAAKREDFYKFESKAKNILMYFPIRPEVGGSSSFNFEARGTPIFEGTGWKLFSANRYKYDCVKRAIMGNIAYPIKSEAIAQYGVLNKILDADIDIYFNIGELDMAANREELHYSDLVQQSILTKLKLIKEELSIEIQKSIDSCTSIWAAKIAARKLFDYQGQLTSFESLFNSGKDLKWQGKNLDYSNVISHFMSSPGQFKIEKYYWNKSYRGGGSCRQKDYFDKIYADEDVVFIINDLPKGGLLRVRNYVRENELTNGVYFITDSIGMFKQFQEELGFTDNFILKASSLPKVVYHGTRSKTNGGKCKVYTYKKGISYRGLDTYWDENEIDPVNDAGVYVFIKRYNAYKEKDGFCIHPDKVSIILNCLDSIGKKPAVVYGLKESRLIKKSPKWINLWTYTTKELEDYISANSLGPLISAKRGIGDIGNADFYRKIGDAASGRISDPYCSFLNFYNCLSVTNHDMVNKAISLAQSISYGFGQATDISKMEQEVLKIYPLLSHVDHYDNKDNKFTQIANYIELVNKSQ